MHELIEDRLHGLLRGTPAMRKRLETLEQEVRTGRKLPGLAADEILRLIGLDGAPASGR
jgi:hypothetical protein